MASVKASVNVLLLALLLFLGFMTVAPGLTCFLICVASIALETS